MIFYETTKVMTRSPDRDTNFLHIVGEVLQWNTLESVF